jgi:hypothetical protein
MGSDSVISVAPVFNAGLGPQPGCRSERWARNDGVDWHGVDSFGRSARNMSCPTNRQHARESILEVSPVPFPTVRSSLGGCLAILTKSPLSCTLLS